MSEPGSIQQALSTIPDEDLRAQCSLLAEKLLAAEAIEHSSWTYRGLGRLIQRDAADPLLHRCIEALSSRRSSQLLEMHFLYFDAHRDDPDGEPIDDEIVRDAYRAGFLVDPHDGREVPNFESLIAPYFVLKGIHGTDR